MNIAQRAAKPDPTGTRITLVSLITFGIALFSLRWISSCEIYQSLSGQLPTVLRWLQVPVWWFILCLVGLYLASRIPPWRALRELGLTAPIGTGLRFGFIATFPMLLGGLLFGSLATDLTAKEIVFGAAIGPLSEEILFRGFTFRQLYRRAGWNLWLAAFTTGLTFGLAHLSKASVQQLTWQGQVGTIAIISVGGMFYAWIFARFKDNLWTVWALHGFMNLWWSVFDMADNPLGGWAPNLMRALTVALAVILVLRFTSSPPARGTISNDTDSMHNQPPPPTG